MRMWKLGAYVLALLAVACGGATETETQTPETEGALTLPLTATSADGKVFKLVGAAFEIMGPQQNILITDTSADTVNVPLAIGAYSIRLHGGWQLERANEPGQRVRAELISPNPLSFSIEKGATSQVRFLFKLQGEGSADVGIHVDSGGSISGDIQFQYASSDPRDGPLFDSLAGQTVPFTLSFETSTISRSTDGVVRRLHVTTGPVTLQFGGMPSEALTGRVAPALNGTTAEFVLEATPYGRVRFLGLRLGMGSPDSPNDDRQFFFTLREQDLLESVLDSEGYPAAKPFQVDSLVSIEKSYSGSRADGQGLFRITPY
ncbi:hypothetical protein F0U62_29660 [Cystobacter fuscus]|uniref:hypothetical protein n=1 Tax=Cystobacter fuscus TaxID=43 RepID=UPI002B30734F|nr:hypothetical protein F0U62_29660 [Cystobacter fuscus]